MNLKLLLPLLFFCATAAANHGTSSHADAAAPNTLEQLRALIGVEFEQSAFLEADDAFQLSIKSIAPNRLEATFAIADGYYLYRNKIKFSGQPGARVGEVTLPPGEIKNDAYFGEQAVFKHDFSAPIALQSTATDAISIDATYQGCAEDGICYSPVTKTLSVQPFSGEWPQLISSAQAQSSDQPFIGEQFIRQSVAATAVAGLPGILLGAFLAGLLLTFTPCVLPMLPILSGVIAGHGNRITRRQGGTLAFAYVLGTMLSYAAIGALAGATGEQLQAYFQNIWAIGILVVVLLTMALSMFGLFTIQVPSFVQSKWQRHAGKLGGGKLGDGKLGGSLLPVFILGAVSAVIVGACVSPVLISFLGFAMTAGSPTLGAAMMMVMALGMGIPLLALGFGVGHWLPRAGRWMKTVNLVFGVMLVGVAIYLLSALPWVPVLLLWGAVLLAIGGWLAAIRLWSPQSTSTIKGVGACVIAYGLVALVGGFTGRPAFLKALPDRLFGTVDTAAVSRSQTQSSALFTRVSNLAELEREFTRAAAEHKLLMLEYYADWCSDCARMEKTTFRDARVRAVLQDNFVTLQVDVTDPHDANGKALKKRFGVFGPPAVLFFDRAGAPLAEQHFYGYRNRTDFHTLIAALAQ